MNIGKDIYTYYLLIVPKMENTLVGAVIGGIKILLWPINILEFNSLSIVSGPVVAVLLCIKRGILFEALKVHTSNSFFLL